ncbi:MAG: hypothetical protein QOJ73_621 [Streptosporangiaceae bacterium]|jgi:hypothetical protein|nr:hypothetical protein [Streptosporangiaceae bacterium]
MPTVGDVTEHPAPRHRLRLAFALFLLAPLVGEYLLGNQPITALPALPYLAPLYGGGALLVRETARRTGRGWPAMVLLGAAYALIEEGPIDQMLWNPHYGGVDMGAVYGGTQVGWLGTSVALLQSVLSMHTVWSICVPIALIESFDRDPGRPWLGRPGLMVTAVVFMAGSVFLAASQHSSEHFMASWAQFAGAAVAVVGLAVLAFVVGRNPRPRIDTAAPRPRAVGCASFGLCSLYWGGQTFLVGGTSPWISVAAWFVLAGVAVTLCVRWSRRRGWGAAHRLALAAGALLTYVWVGFTQGLSLGVPLVIGLIGSTLLGIGALLLLAAAARALHRHRAGEPARPTVPA